MSTNAAAAMTTADQPVEFRRAIEADLPSIKRVIAAAYRKYLTRMDRPPAPLLRDYRQAVETGCVWVTGSPVTGLISLTETDDVMLIETLPSTPTSRGTSWDDD
jgi:hypothetical protein